MASYIQEHLLKNEVVKESFQVSYWAFAKPILWAVVALAASVAAFMQQWITAGTYLIAIPPNVILYVWLMRQTTEMAVTDLRVIIKIGLVKRDTWEVYLTRIEGVEVDQSVMGRLFNYGDLRVRGVGTEVIPIKCVHNPLGFRKAVFAGGVAAGVSTSQG